MTLGARRPHDARWWLALMTNDTITSSAVNGRGFRNGVVTKLGSELTKLCPTSKVVSSVAFNNRVVELRFRLHLNVDDVDYDAGEHVFLIKVNYHCKALLVQQMFSMAADAPAVVRGLYLPPPTPPRRR